MNRLLVTIAVAAMAGAVAALAAAFISQLTAGSLSPLAGGAIGVAFGITAGNIVSRATAGGRRSIGAAVLRGIVAGLTAGLTIFFLQNR
jgi:hypothetical protein